MLLVAVPVLVLVAVAGLALALRSGSGDERPAPARADEPLAYLRGGERVVVDVDTRAPLVGLLFAQLAPRLSGGGVRASDLALLLGGRGGVAAGGGGGGIALVGPDRAGPPPLPRRLRP